MKTNKAVKNTTAKKAVKKNAAAVELTEKAAELQDARVAKHDAAVEAKRHAAVKAEMAKLKKSDKAKRAAQKLTKRGTVATELTPLFDKMDREGEIMRENEVASTKGKKSATVAAIKKSAAKKKAVEVEEEKALEVYVSTRGRVRFLRHLATALGGNANFATVEVAKGAITITTATKSNDSTIPVRQSHGRPYISATKQLTEAGWDGKKSLVIAVDLINGKQFAVKGIA